MALDGSYSGMLASVADFLNRQDLSSSIGDFIAIAEADLNRKLIARPMISLTTLTATNGAVALPSDFISPVLAISSANSQPLDQVDADAFAVNSFLGGLGSGSPACFAVIGGNLNVYPAPTGAVSVLLSYYQRLPPLASNPLGNWLSLSHPDAYLYGALTAAAPYLQDDDRVQVWGSLYANAVEAINASDLRQYGARLTVSPAYTDNRYRYRPVPQDGGGSILDFSDPANSALIGVV